MNARNGNKWFFQGMAALFLVLPAVLSAQEPISGSALPSYGKTLRLDPGSPSVHLPFWGDQTSSLALTVSSLVKNLGIKLVSPDGAVFTYGVPNGSGFEYAIFPDPLLVPDAPGAHFYFVGPEKPLGPEWPTQRAAEGTTGRPMASGHLEATKGVRGHRPDLPHPDRSPCVHA